MLPMTVPSAFAVFANGLSDLVLYGFAVFTTGRMAWSATFHRTAEGERADVEARQRAALDNARSTFRHPAVLTVIAFASLVKFAFALGSLF